MEHAIVSLISRHGYWAIFLLMTLESACIPIPSEAIMLFGGSLAAGVTIAGVNSHLNIVNVALLGAFGNLLGSLIAYWVGMTGGRAAIDRWGKYLLIRHHDIDKTEAFFARRGDSAVLIGRVLPVVRTFISFPAGIAEMPVMKFSALTLLGSLPWTFALAYLGKALAGNWQKVSKYGTLLSAVIGLILVLIIIRWYINRRNDQQRNSSKEKSPADS